MAEDVHPQKKSRLSLRLSFTKKDVKAPRLIQSCYNKGNTQFAIVADKDVYRSCREKELYRLIRLRITHGLPETSAIGLIQGISLVIQMIVFQMSYCLVPILPSFAPGCAALF